MAEQQYQRDKNGIRLDLLGGMNTVLSPDLLQSGYPYIQNCRRLLQGRTIARPPLGGNLLTEGLSDGPTSLLRMNDPSGTYVLIIGAGDKMYVADSGGTPTEVLSGLSAKPLGFVSFRPNTSPEPWTYVGDENGMWKVRPDGLVRKAGIAEPQSPPTVGGGSTGGGGPNWLIYRYVYRASETGAMSNPSPESAPVTLAQSNKFGTVNGSEYLTKLTYNATQYEYVSVFRTKGIPVGTVTDYVIAHHFGLTVPAGVKIDGVKVALNWAGQYAGTGVWTGAALYYAGGIIGQAKAPAIQNNQFIGASGTTDTQGTTDDSWGTVLTPDIVNDPTFGFGVQITTEPSGGSDRSFLYTFSITVYYTDVSAGVSAVASTDPQVDKIDFYRIDPGLDNFTYVGTVPNGTSTFSDTSSALEIAQNPLLQFDNYEPFPSIDLPRKGVVNVAANGAVTYVSGDQFNTRWLPGDIIRIGVPGSTTSLPYTLRNRPTSPNNLIAATVTTDETTGYITIGYPPTGSNLIYEISEPTLAAEPSPVIWGPTPDNAGSFYFGLDPNNPGDLLWSKGNNFDSAPDTNRMFVTSPSEPLMNGVVTSELSAVFSTERFWLIYPNFGDAVATVTGTQGQQWTLMQSAGTRGLYMRYAIDALGALIAYRAKDCICISMGGGPEQSITDSIYNLFPHSGSIPQPVTIAGNTVHPPDDTTPDAQTITVTPEYIFYDYSHIYIQPNAPLTEDFVPATVVAEGEGIPWQNPADATGSGVGEIGRVVISSFSISGNIVTLATEPQSLLAGQTVAISNFATSTGIDVSYLDGKTLTVLASGLSDTSFKATFAHVDVPSTVCSGFANPTAQFTFAVNNPPATPSPGQGVVWSIAQVWNSSHTSIGSATGTNTTGDLSMSSSGPFAPGNPAAVVTWSNFKIPTLPPGAVVDGMYLVISALLGDNRDGATVVARYQWGVEGWNQFMISTQMNGNQFPVRIGPTVEHGISALSTLSIDSYIACLTLIPDLAVSLGITGVAVAIYYHVDGSTLAPTTQLQTLAASNCGLAIPSDSPVTGIEIDFSAGYPYGDPADLTVQLTLNGEPIGIVRNLTVGPWATDYEFGGPADIWGLGPLTGADINGPTGLGIDISGDLPVGARVNLNNLRGVVHYLGPKEAHGNTTLVYDIEAKGWSVDVYSPVVNCHLWVVGANQLLTGCVDGTVRELTSGGSEVGTAILGTRCESGGDARALKRIGDVFIKALVNGSNRINLALYQTRFTVPLGGFAPTSLPPPPITGSGSLASFTVDFSAGFGNDVDDIAALLSWPLGSGNILDLWQPDWTELPEVIQDRPSDWTDCGIAGNKLIRGMIIEMDSFNADKAIKVQRSDSETLVAPDQALVKVNGQTLVPFTFAPFTAHQLRIISTDGVPWRYWGAKFICDPWPDYTPLYSAWMNLGSEGAKYIRGLLLPMDTNGALANFRVVTSDGDTVSFSATTPTAHKTPVAFAFTPPVVAHHVQIQCLSNAALWTEEAVWMADPYPEIIPAYTPIMEVAGPDNKFVQGIKIVGDSANLPVQFRILYDGGQVGPLTEARTFNGKQTQVYSFNPPFVAHDLQIVPQSSVRIWTDDSKWVFQPYADSATIWQTEASSFGMAGWIHLFQMNLAYIATQPVTVTATTDQGTFTMTYPAGGSGVNPAKVLMKPPANKWKICSFTITSPAKLSIWKDSCEIWLKQWGWMGEYQKINPFGGPSSPSAEI